MNLYGKVTDKINFSAAAVPDFLREQRRFDMHQTFQQTLSEVSQCINIKALKYSVLAPKTCIKICLNTYTRVEIRIFYMLC